MKELPKLEVLDGPSLNGITSPRSEAGSPRVWKSLEELAGLVEPTAEISGQEFLARVEASLAGPNRRDFLKASAGSASPGGRLGLRVSAGRIDRSVRGSTREHHPGPALGFRFGSPHRRFRVRGARQE